MTSGQNLDEQAIRAQMDAHLEKMGEASLGPDAGENAPRKKGGGHGHGHHGAPAQDIPHLANGTITGIVENKVMVELGPKSHGQISLEEFDEPPTVGATFEFSLVSIQDGMWSLSRKEARTLATWKELEKGRVVKAQVIGENSGGLELKVGPVAAFMPASEIDVKRVEGFTGFVGETWVCEVIEVAPKRKRVVLSRRAVLARERRESRERAFETIAVGQVVKGKVDKLEPFGAFIDIGNGVSGLLHVSNISHQRIADPAQVLALGQDVEVQILEIKPGKKIGLGMKQLATDPWELAAAKLKAGQVTQGKVVRLQEFGAFVELEPGVEGLIHKSQVSPERMVKLSDAVKVGDTVTVRVVNVDPKARRIGLSRLTDRGHLIGSDDDLGNEERARYVERGTGSSAGTNLGNLLREAMAKREKK
jgi:ribosomal protein S1